MGTSDDSTGQIGIDACIQRSWDMIGVLGELPLDPACKEQEKTYGEPNYVPGEQGNLGITYPPRGAW
jgi:hypothetical protein